MKHLGFTGTRNGMTSAQRQVVERMLENGGVFTAHHGDCVGADADFHELVRADADGNVIVVHPPLNDSDRAWCIGDEKREPLSYMKRNAQIVAAALGFDA